MKNNFHKLADKVANLLRTQELLINVEDQISILRMVADDLEAEWHDFCQEDTTLDLGKLPAFPPRGTDLKKLVKVIQEEERGGHPRFYRILEEMADLHSRKNHGYSETNNPLSNLRECAKFGIKPTDGVITRMSDKWSRLGQLWGGKEDKVGESIKDTLMDLAIYSILLMILIEEGDTLKG